MPSTPTYHRTLARVEDYFDRTATRTWEQLTSDAPVSRIRATVRAGRDRMRALILNELPDDLTGARVLDAGCGTGALAAELATRGAEVLAVDISPSLIGIAQERLPEHLRAKVQFKSGDLRDPSFGTFDFACAMDSLIYYDAQEIVSVLGDLSPRLAGKIVFTLPPRTPLLMAMWRVGKLFPRRDRSPIMVPQNVDGLDRAVSEAGLSGRLTEIKDVNSGFYHSTLYSFEPGQRV